MAGYRPWASGVRCRRATTTSSATALRRGSSWRVVEQAQFREGGEELGQVPGVADESREACLCGQGPSVDQANRTMQANPITRQYAANGRRVLVVNQRVRNRTDR